MTAAQTSLIPVIEAVEWREAARGGGSQPQVFRLSDGRFAIVKFPENPQGEHVLANDYLCCKLAEYLRLPINRAVLVSIDERLLQEPRRNGRIPATFSAGIRCGMIRLENAELAQPNDIMASCVNATDLHGVIAFEQLVCRNDSRQLLIYSHDGAKQFVAYDYGYAFGGQPNWSRETLASMAEPVLPENDPYSGQPYADGKLLGSAIEGLRVLTEGRLQEVLRAISPPRWGVSLEDVDGLIIALHQRAGKLINQFNDRYRRQLEVL